MLSNKVKQKLASFTELPSIPAVLSAVLETIDDENASAKSIATLIEKDQGLTARILRVANSPFYGMARSISTIDLAIVILGTNVVKEILLTIFTRKVFQKVSPKNFNVRQFWQYSIFCGAASRYISRKLKYKLVSEAFVTGLMHDIGLLIFMNLFRNNFSKVIRLQTEIGMSLIEAEIIVFDCTHCDVGAWLMEKWNFPEKIIKALELHHTQQEQNIDSASSHEGVDFHTNTPPSGSRGAELRKASPSFSKLEYPLAAIVSMAEWFAAECNMKTWAVQSKEPDYYISDQFVMQMVDDELLDYESALVVLKQSIINEFDKYMTI